MTTYLSGFNDFRGIVAMTNKKQIIKTILCVVKVIKIKVLLTFMLSYKRFLG